jgi:hypothetical protein
MGAASIRHSPRPLNFEGDLRRMTRADFRRGNAEARHCEERRDEAIQTASSEDSGLLRFARNDEAGFLTFEYDQQAAFPCPAPAVSAPNSDTLPPHL